MNIYITIPIAQDEDGTCVLDTRNDLRSRCSVALRCRSCAAIGKLFVNEAALAALQAIVPFLVCARCHRQNVIQS